MRQLIWMLVIGTICGVSLHAERLGDLTLAANSTALLEGRLTIRLPEQARIEARQRGLMSAPEAQTDETRVIIDAGPQRMVVMAYEVFAKAGADLKAQIRQTLNESLHLTDRPYPLTPPLKAYAYLPNQPTETRDANFLMGVVVMRSDGTVQRLEAYVNPAGAHGADAGNLARQILATVAQGPKELNTRGGDRQLAVLTDRTATWLTVPDNYLTTLQAGDDFLVYHIRKIVPYGQSDVSLGVYFGNHPTKQNFPSKVPGVIFGRKVDWLEQVGTDNGKSIISYDCLVQLGSGGGPGSQFADVFFSASNDAEVQELKNMAETLRIAPRKAP